MREAHPGCTVHTRAEMIEDEQAQEHTAHQLYQALQRKEKKKYIDEGDDDEDDDEMYYPSQDFNNDSQVNPKFRPSKKELRDADREGDS